MRSLESWSRLLTVTFVAVFTGVVLSGSSTFAQGVQGVPDLDQVCLKCHGNKDLKMDLGGGEQLPVYIDSQAFSGSVHGGKVGCTDCHADIKGYPHPSLPVESRREFALKSYKVCQNCHPETYSKAQDSVHAQALTNGNQSAPICTDCHGAHTVGSPDEPKARISKTCSKCHEAIYTSYASSVHGKALTEEGNTDVPTCVDCHGIHNIHDPRTASFRVESPDLCARCHSDATLMAKYNLSDRVYSTYTAEFHGATIQFYKLKFPTIWCYKAVCTDCHGVHNIKKTSDQASSVAPANLQNTCQKCHPDAGPKFAAAWIGHYEPTAQTGVVTFYVNWFYKIIIPLLVGGFALFIFADLLRKGLNRLKKGRASR